MAVDFSRFSNTDFDTTPFQYVIFGAKGGLLEVELNEAQYLGFLRDKIALDTIGNRVRGGSISREDSGETTIKGNFIIEGYAFSVSNAKITTNNGDSIYAKVSLETLDKDSVIHTSGYVVGEEIENTIVDKRVGVETTKRMAIKLELSTTETDESVKIAEVSSSGDPSLVLSNRSLTGEIGNVSSDFKEHSRDTNNPHEVTKAQVGLGNADNTSDINKPVSTLQQEYADKKDISSKASGETPLTVNDSAEGNIIAFKGNGYTEQKSYSGKNLLNPDLNTHTVNGITCTNNGDGTYTFNGTATANTWCSFNSLTQFSGELKIICLPYGSGDDYFFAYVEDKDGSFYAGDEIGEGLVATFPNKPTKLTIRIPKDKTLNNFIVKPMITKDLSATYDDFEPYVGGIPSPNPDYPQEIKGYGMKWFDGEWIQGRRIYPNGTLDVNSGYVCNKNLIKCEIGDIFSYIDLNPNDELNRTVELNIYDENMKFVADLTPYDEQAYLTCPQNSKYLDIQINQDNITPETAGNIKLIKNGFEYCAPVKSVGKNLLNPDTLALGIYTSTTTLNNNYYHYENIVKEGEIYTGIGTGGFMFAILDENRKCLNVYGTYDEFTPCTIAIPKDGKYLWTQGSVSINETISAKMQLEYGDTSTTYEPYQESTALIPTSQPFYQGDYIQLNADGSGVEHRENGRVIFDGSIYKSSYKSSTTNAHSYLLDYLTYVVRKPSSDLCEITCNRFRRSTNTLEDISGIYTVINNIGKLETYVYFPLNSEINTLNKFNVWLQTNNVETVCPLETPTDTPLTSSQLQEIRKLMSFNNQTTFSTEPYNSEFEVEYYKNTKNGKVVGGVESKLNFMLNNFFLSTSRIRNDITSRLSDLPKAIAEQNLEKYGYKIGDYFKGQRGYTYYLANLNTYYGDTDMFKFCFDRPHITIVVNTNMEATWGWSDFTERCGYDCKYISRDGINSYIDANYDMLDERLDDYSVSFLRYFLNYEARKVIKDDLKYLFKGKTGEEHLIPLKDYKIPAGIDNTSSTMYEYLYPLTEMQIMGTTYCSVNPFQNINSLQKLELFDKYSLLDLDIDGWLQNLHREKYTDDNGFNRAEACCLYSGYPGCLEVHEIHFAIGFINFY